MRAPRARHERLQRKRRSYAVTDLPIINNDNFADWVRGWCDLSDNIVISVLRSRHPCAGVYDARRCYDDIKFLRNAECAGLFVEAETKGLGLQYRLTDIIYKMNWNPDMTEKNSTWRSTVSSKGFGDGWGYIREYIDGTLAKVTGSRRSVLEMLEPKLSGLTYYLS